MSPWVRAVMSSELQDPLSASQEMLEGASAVIRKSRFCWLLTENYDSSPAGRPMGPILEADEHLQVRFITDKRSRKAEEIWNNGRVQLLFSRESADAFVILTGDALVVTDRDAIAARWKTGYEQYFPTAEDRSNAAFIEVRPRILKLWIRGVTREPYGFRPAVLTCGDGSQWTAGRLMPNTENSFV
jgi:general stress protein 26